MKHLITLITVAVGALIMTPSEVQARPYHHDGYRSGGEVEVRKVRRLVGYTKYGRPIYRWKTIVVRHKPYGYSHRHRR